MKRQSYPYMNASLSVEERTDDLVARMTLEEKISQMGGSLIQEMMDGYAFNVRKMRVKINDLAIGAIHNILWVDYKDKKLTIKLNIKVINAVQRYLREKTRLGIPALMTGEGVHGHWAHQATVFPHSIAMASTWNPNRAFEMAESVARECRAAGVNRIFSPLFDLAREPRWGRVQETYGEDPYLVARMGVAFIQGAQGEEPGIDHSHCACTAKHFVGHGTPESGINMSPINVGPREIRQLYLKPFEAAVREAKVLSVMPAYHEIDGIPMVCHREYLTKVLRQEWGFQGYTYSDWGSIYMLHGYHRVAPTPADAGRMALEAGMDMDAPMMCPDASMMCYGRLLLKMVNEGQVAMTLIDQAVRRILRVKFLLGLFENPYGNWADAKTIRNCPSHRKLARAIAEEAIILLKNDGNLLPLKKTIRSIAVIGPNADVAQLGDYSGWNASLISPLAGIRKRAGKSVVVHYARGCGLWEQTTDGFQSARDAASQSDVTIVVVGESTQLCTEGTDTHDLELAGVQLDLIKAIVATGTPTVVVLVNGRPLAIPWIAQEVPAILEMWFCGEEQGTALAEILFGDKNPSGKLPVSLPRSVGHLPCFYNKKPSALGFHKQPGSTEKPGRDYVFSSPTPLFEFGFGLSYTTFSYRQLSITPKKLRKGATVHISAKVKNTGKVSGEEVVQLYIRDVYSSVEISAKQLKRFKKIPLSPRQETVVTFVLGPEDLALIGQQMESVVESGTFEIMIGPLKGSFDVL